MSAHLPANPHAAAAQQAAAAAKDEPLLHQEVTTQQALIEATLALAHEQRTASLIALYALSTGYNCTPMEQDTKEQLHTTILERLAR